MDIDTITLGISTLFSVAVGYFALFKKQALKAAIIAYKNIDGDEFKLIFNKVNYIATNYNLFDYENMSDEEKDELKDECLTLVRIIVVAIKD